MRAPHSKQDDGNEPVLEPAEHVGRLSAAERARLAIVLSGWSVGVGLVSGLQQIVQPFTSNLLAALVTAVGALVLGGCLIVSFVLWRARSVPGRPKVLSASLAAPG